MNQSVPKCNQQPIVHLIERVEFLNGFNDLRPCKLSSSPWWCDVFLDNGKLELMDTWWEIIGFWKYAERIWLWISSFLPNCSSCWSISIRICAGLILKTGENLCLQYSLKRRVSNIRGMMKPVATDDRFMSKIPRAITCVNNREKIAELWTIGQNSPPLSYFRTYTLRI